MRYYNFLILGKKKLFNFMTLPFAGTEAVSLSFATLNAN